MLIIIALPRKSANKGGSFMEITYTRKGDYLYPNFTLDPMDTVEIGKYGQVRRRFLREHREAMYWGVCRGYPDATSVGSRRGSPSTSGSDRQAASQAVPRAGQGRGLPRLCWAHEQSDRYDRGNIASRSDLRLTGVLLLRKHFSSRVKFERRRSDALI